MSNPFASVEVTKVPRSFFNLRKRVIGSYNYGKLYPVDIQDCLPGDTIKTFLASKIESLPMSAPNKTPVDVEFFQFFTPYRLLDENFEKYLAGNEDGTDFDYTPPKWETNVGGVQTLWDYFGFGLPVKKIPSPDQYALATEVIPTMITREGPNSDPDNTGAPLRYPRDAYNKIWNLYFRDETFMEEVNEETNDKLLYSCWKKDYFTSVLKAQCKPNTPPALSLSGIIPVDYVSSDSGAEFSMKHNAFLSGSNTDGIHLNQLGDNGAPYSVTSTINLDDAGTFGVDEMRLVFQIV